MNTSGNTRDVFQRIQATRREEAKVVEVGGQCVAGGNLEVGRGEVGRSCIQCTTHRYTFGSLLCWDTVAAVFHLLRRWKRRSNCERT